MKVYVNGPKGGHPPCYLSRELVCPDQRFEIGFTVRESDTRKRITLGREHWLGFSSLVKISGPEIKRCIDVLSIGNVYMSTGSWISLNPIIREAIS